MENQETIKETVRQRYAQAALGNLAAVGEGDSSGVSSCCNKGYAPEEIAVLPLEAVAVSLGCGNPVAVAELKPGEVVLDLGSGGGIDVLLSARRVGPTGRAYGLDMTDEMLALARANQQRAGIANAEFLKGEMENVPLPDGSMDVIISNCVVNLSPDKDRVLREAYRVLRPGGRIAIADIVVRGAMPPAIRRSLELWSGCIAGALEEGEYRAKLEGAGFTAVGLELLHTYEPSVGSDVGKALARLPAEEQIELLSRFGSYIIRAQKPAGGIT